MSLSAAVVLGLQAICQFFVGVRDVITEVVQDLVPVFQGLHEYAKDAAGAVAAHCRDIKAQRVQILAHLEQLQAAFDRNDFQTIDQFLLEELKLKPSELCKHLYFKSHAHVNEDMAMHHYRIALLSFLRKPNKLLSHIKAAIIFTNLTTEIHNWVFSVAIDWVKDHLHALAPWQFFGRAKGKKLQTLTVNASIAGYASSGKNIVHPEALVLDKLSREEKHGWLLSVRCELAHKDDSSSQSQVTIIDAVLEGTYERRKEVLSELGVSDSNWRALSQRAQRRAHKGVAFLTG